MQQNKKPNDTMANRDSKKDVKENVPPLKTVSSHDMGVPEATVFSAVWFFV